MGESEKTTKTTLSQLSAGEQPRPAETPVGQQDSETQMGDENNIIDVEVEEIVDSDNLPAVILRANSYVSDTPIEAEQGQKTADGRDWPHGPTPIDAAALTRRQASNVRTQQFSAAPCAASTAELRST